MEDCVKFSILDPGGSPLNFFLRRQFSRVFFQHHRNPVLYRVTESAGFADQFGGGLAIEQWSFADWTYEYIEQFFIHGGRSVQAGRESFRPVAGRGLR